MIRSNSLIFCWNSSRVGKAISESSLIGVLLRRAQDREVDEVHVGVGFQEIAPGALARMRLAGDEQHAQLLADALDGNDGPVVGLRQLVGQPLHFELDHVGTAMLDAHIEREGRIGSNLLSGENLSVPAHGHERRTRAAALHDLRPDGLVLADDAEAGRLQELDLPVALVGTAGDERVQRRPEAEAFHGLWNVVHHAVGNEDDAGEPVRRHVGQSVRQSGEQARAVIAVAVIRLDEAGFHVGEGTEATFQFGPHLIGHGRAVAQGLRGRTVDDHRHDILHLLSILLHERRVGESQEYQPEGDGPQDRDGAAGDQRKDRQQGDGRSEGPEAIGRDEGREAD
jgi:hypothetical protein